MKAAKIPFSDRAPSWDRFRPQFLQFGFCVSLTVVILLFNYTTYEKMEMASYVVETDQELETIPVRTHVQKVQKKLKPIKVEVNDEIVPMVDEDPVEYVDELVPEEISGEEFIAEDLAPVIPTKISEKKTIAVPPPPEEEELDAPLIRAEIMPIFGDCKDEESAKKRNECTSESLMSYIYANVNYPAQARENNIEGMVVARFVIDKDGQVIDHKLMRDIGGGCGDEVLRVLKKLSAWIPGRQNGREVKVMYTVPVRFSLSSF